MNPPLERRAPTPRPSASAGRLPGRTRWQQRAQGRDTRKDNSQRRLERAVRHRVGDRVRVIGEVDCHDGAEPQRADDAGEEAAGERRDEDQLLVQGHLEAAEAWDWQDEDHHVCGDVDGAGEDVGEELVAAVPAACDCGVPVVGEGLADEEGGEDGS